MTDQPDLGALFNLQSVQERRVGGHLIAVALEFDEGVLRIAVVGETDEISLAVLDRSDGLYPPDEWLDVTTEPTWAALLGRHASYWWLMTNQLGYCDGVQLELCIRGGSCSNFQWIAEASRLTPAQVTSSGSDV